MRLTLSFAVLLILNDPNNGLNAFQYPIALKRLSLVPSPLRMSSGNWDNDDFLDALSKGPEDVVERKYTPPPDEEEVGQGGSRFKEIMEAAKRGQPSRPMRPIPNPFLTNPPPPPPSQPTTPSLDPDQLSVEDQARLFRELFQKTMSGVSNDPVPYTAPRPTKEDPRGGRPVGRNKDADSIANTSDLYFAQLKRDSTVRTIARIRGDQEKANQVFEDEGIQRLAGLLHNNPYLAE